MAADTRLATFLRTWRERALLTQEQLARDSGLHVRTIRRLEAGSLRPRSDSLRLLVDALHLTDAERAQLIATARTPDLAGGSGVDLGMAAVPGPFVVPAQLPHAVADFVGRTRYLDELNEWLDKPVPAVTIIVIAGTAGVGKTSLAVHWAHLVADRFPDGQLYVNLRGYDPVGTAMPPAQAVRGFLDAIEVPPQRIPADPNAQTALYRSLLAGRRVLVALDNALDAEQVRPLLPGTSGCLVVVTSRNQLAGLIATEGAHPLVLERLPPTEARELLANRLGTDQVAAEPRAVDEVIDRCARLPLALAVVAARAASNPGFSLESLAAELRHSHDSLDPLSAGDPASDVRAVFSWSYRTLSAPAATMFRLLGLHPGPDLSIPAAGSLAGAPPDRVRPLLRELAGTHLAIEHVPARFTLHDLLRAYASEQARAVDPDADRHLALGRMLDYYLHTAIAADRLLDPHRRPITVPPPRVGVRLEEMTGHDHAVSWFTAEHAVLLGALDTAAAMFPAHAWRLAWALSTYLHRRGHWHHWAATQQTALAAACRCGDESAAAYAHRSLGGAYTRLARPDEAVDHLVQALAAYQRIGDRLGEAHTHLNVAWLSEERGRLEEAVAHSRRALHLYETGRHIVGQARALNAIGWYHAKLGRHREALTHCEQALVLFEEIGDRCGAAAAWDSLGFTHHHLGRHRQAADCYRHALDLDIDLGDRFGQADTLIRLGDAYDAAGDGTGARAAWAQALEILDQLDHPHAERVHDRLRGPSRV